MSVHFFIFSTVISLALGLKFEIRNSKRRGLSFYIVGNFFSYSKQSISSIAASKTLDRILTESTTPYIVWQPGKSHQKSFQFPNLSLNN